MREVDQKVFKNKNIVELCGKPLIAWSIEQALAVVEEVVVSTDCPEIAKISQTAMQRYISCVRPL